MSSLSNLRFQWACTRNYHFSKCCVSFVFKYSSYHIDKQPSLRLAFENEESYQSQADHVHLGIDVDEE